MKNLLYKEFHLAIHPLFYLMPLSGALLLIPEWVYFIAMMYFIWTIIPNVFSVGKAQNDIGYCAMLPVRRSDIVKSRIMSMVILEVLQIAVAAVFAVINLLIYHKGNFLLDTNAAFIGFTFIMYGIHNIVFFPMFYKTAYKIGLPVIAALACVMLFVAAVELSILLIPALRIFDGRENWPAQFAVLAGGMVIFALLNAAALKISTKRFKSIDL